MTPRNVIELELLLQLYYMGDPPDHRRSSAHIEAAHHLVLAGVAEWVTPSSIAITEAGKFYMCHLVTVPYPEERTVFHIPKEATA